MDDDWFDDSESLYPDGMDGPTIKSPSVKAPSVDIPSATGDVFQRSEIARLFVLHVFVWNAVVLLLSLGAMLIYFRSDWETGQRLLIAGGILAVYGVYRWPRGSDDSDDSASSDDGDDGGDDDEDAEAAGEDPAARGGERGADESERRDSGSASGADEAATDDDTATDDEADGASAER